MAKMLEVRGLAKYFGKKPALDNVSFQMDRGEIYGLLGHNGAGKSTTLGIILGMIAPDAGEVFIDGISVQKKRALALRKVGAIFEAPAFYDYMSGWENLKILVGYSGGLNLEDGMKIVEQVGLSERIHSKVRTYSHGMRQRLALAQALLPKPELLLLDEPTDGLDPEGIKWFRDFILRLREKEGITVLFNSHLLSEVELMCDRVAILRDGSRVYEGGITDLDQSEAVFQIQAEPWEQAAEIIRGMGGRTIGDGSFLAPPDVEVSQVLAALVHSGIRVNELRRERRSLEDVYMGLVKKIL